MLAFPALFAVSCSDSLLYQYAFKVTQYGRTHHRDTEAQRNNYKNHEDTKIRGTRGFLSTFPFDAFLCVSVSLW